MKFYFPAAVNIKMVVFWIVTTCRLLFADILRGTYCTLVQGWKKEEASDAFETPN